MGILGSIIGGIAGALLGDKIGIAGFGGAINGAIPGAITGLVIGSLLDDKISNSKERRFPLPGTPEPELNIEIRRLETEIIDAVCGLRAAHGLSVPEIDEYLSVIARYKALDMSQNGDVDFLGGTYGRLSEMLTGFGYRYNRAAICGADVFYGQKAYLPLWIKNSDVEKYLLEDNYVKLGVGYVKNGGYFSVILVK